MLGNFDDVQKVSKTSVEATTQAFGAISKSTQAIVSEMADYSKRSFENSTKALEKLLGVRSLDKAIEVQSEYAKSMFDDCKAQMTKLGQLYADLARESFKPFETQLTKPPSTK
jgi:hypothetical protein